MKKRTLGSPEKWLRTAATVMEALPYLRAFSGKIFVVKYGGHAMGDGKLATQFAQDIVMLKQVGIHPVVVHGGGPQIGEMLKKLQIQSEFVDGLRVTDAPTMQIAEMVLSGSLNKQIVTALQEAGGRAVGISGKDGKLIVARKLTRTKKDPDSNIEKVLDLGFVGEPHQVNPEILLQLAQSDFIPVVAPVAIGEDGQTYNVNADTAAGAIAGALKASKLLLLTDVSGVLDKEGQLISELTVSEIEGLRADGTITGGMIPKLETCADAINQGVEAAHILDGRIPHVLLVETLTELGVGTMVQA